MKILAGIPSIKPDDRFLRDIQGLFDKHEVEVSWVRGKSLVDAQNELADQVLSSSHEALLFLEEDHWGHTQEMLDDLVKSDADITAINYFSRWPHFPSTLLEIMPNKKAPNNYHAYSHTSGVHEVDMCGFGMTLIRRHVLEAMESPIFRLNGMTKRNVATDRNFCERAKSLGFKIKGIFDHDLVHAGISKENEKKMRLSFMTAFMRNRMIGVR